MHPTTMFLALGAMAAALVAAGGHEYDGKKDTVTVTSVSTYVTTETEFQNHYSTVYDTKYVTETKVLKDTITETKVIKDTVTETKVITDVTTDTKIVETTSYSTIHDTETITKTETETVIDTSYSTVVKGTTIPVDKIITTTETVEITDTETVTKDIVETSFVPTTVFEPSSYPVTVYITKYKECTTIVTTIMPTSTTKPKVSVTDTVIETVTLCPIPTNPPGFKLPECGLGPDLTWGCKPGYVCYPPKKDCNLFPDSPADDFVCEEHECIPAPPVEYKPWGENETDYYKPHAGYFNLDPLAFGLSYDIFAVPEEITTEFCGTKTVITTSNYGSQTCLTHYPPEPTDETSCPPPFPTPDCTTTSTWTYIPPQPTTPCTTSVYYPSHKPDTTYTPEPGPTSSEYAHYPPKEKDGWYGHGDHDGHGEYKREALLVKRDDTMAPSVCFDDCNDCYTEAQKVGKSDALCNEGSVFRLSLEACYRCMEREIPKAQTTDKIYGDRKFSQFLDFCKESKGIEISGPVGPESAASEPPTESTAQATSNPDTNPTVIDNTTSSPEPSQSATEDTGDGDTAGTSSDSDTPTGTSTSTSTTSSAADQSSSAATVENAASSQMKPSLLTLIAPLLALFFI